MDIEQIYRSNRTCLCTVVFLDIVAYSQQPVFQQLEIKKQFNALLDEALASGDPNFRLILDTGDGAALCFLGDPEEALFVGLRLRDAFYEHAELYGPSMEVRIGIHLGPVKVVKDINGQFNTIGDGVNVAQRIMNFAAPNQLLVSRAFYEVVSCLSQEYPQLFNYFGLHKDKHIREHVIYEVALTRSQPPSGDMMSPEVVEVSRLAPVAPPVAEVVLSESLWDAAVLQQLTALLSTVIGPMARVLVKQAAQQAADMQTLVQMLATHIPPGRERQLFLHQVTSLPTPPSEAPPVMAPPPVPPPPPVPALSEAKASQVSPPSWDPAVLQTATNQLALYLGPVAKILVQRVSRTTTDPATLYRALTEHLSTPQEKANFLRQGGFAA